MANQEYIQVARDPIIKDKKSTDGVQHEYTDQEQAEKVKIEEILNSRESYSRARLSKEKEWTDSYKMYQSFIDTTRNPFLSNLFIPKTHEAVELLSAFLIGTNQSITAAPENNGDTYKADVAGKWLEFLWRKELKARLKALTWIKQGIVFGNGVMKVGFDPETKKPWMNNTSIEDIYFDYYQPYIQDSDYIIHEIRKSPEKVKDDTKYTAKDAQGNLLRNSVVTGGSSPYSDQAGLKFSSYDKSLTGDICDGKVVIVEAWCKSSNKLITLAPTALGWRILREMENPNYYIDKDEKKIPFRPFVKLRFKTSPLANRAYDTGAVYPTVKIQKAFNDLTNQYFDNVVLINNAMWIKRRGARINPAELVRRPGGFITVGDINQDLKSDVPADVKQSIIEMLNRLDSEFQQASMVVNLLKGIDNGASNTATEAQLGQQNVQTLLEMIDENIGDAMSELGDMLLAISLNNTSEMQSLKMFENDAQVGILEFDPKNIMGRYDIKISADRSAGTSKVIRQKQLLDFLKIIGGDPALNQQFPNLRKKTLEKWLEEAGFSDTKYFFEEGQTNNQPPAPEAIPALAPGGANAGSQVSALMKSAGMGVPTA